MIVLDFVAHLVGSSTHAILVQDNCSDDILAFVGANKLNYTSMNSTFLLPNTRLYCTYTDRSIQPFIYIFLYALYM
jgi:hypothetical protein